jgi:hypothetical protein
MIIIQKNKGSKVLKYVSEFGMVVGLALITMIQQFCVVVTVVATILVE